jgi:hypothetical protein
MLALLCPKGATGRVKLQKQSVDIPIEILAFNFDVGHAIANLALPHFP